MSGRTTISTMACTSPVSPREFFSSGTDKPTPHKLTHITLPALKKPTRKPSRPSSPPSTAQSPTSQNPADPSTSATA